MVNMVKLVLVCSFFPLLFAGCSPGNAKIEIINSAVSPSYEHIATEYLYLVGGSIGGCSRAIRVSKNSDSQKTPTYRNHFESVFISRCGVELTVTWLSNQTLEIEYDVNDLSKPIIEMKHQDVHGGIDVVFTSKVLEASY